MKDWIVLIGLAIGSVLAVVGAFAAVIAFYAAMIGGFLGVAYLVFKAIAGA